MPDVKIAEVAKKTVKLGDPLEETINIVAEKKIEVEEVHVNGHKIEKKADPPADAHFELVEKALKITVGKMTADLAGHYQAKFKVGDDGAEVVTKNILEVTLREAQTLEQR